MQHRLSAVSPQLQWKLAGDERSPISPLRVVSSAGSPPMNALSRLGWFALAINLASIAAACEAPCERAATDSRASDLRGRRIAAELDLSPQHVLARSGHRCARVAQYMRTPPVEPLEDERNVTSRYRRIAHEPARRGWLDRHVLRSAGLGQRPRRHRCRVGTLPRCLEGIVPARRVLQSIARLRLRRLEQRAVGLRQWLRRTGWYGNGYPGGGWRRAGQLAGRSKGRGRTTAGRTMAAARNRLHSRPISGRRCDNRRECRRIAPGRDGRAIYWVRRRPMARFQFFCDV